MIAVVRKNNNRNFYHCTLSDEFCNNFLFKTETNIKFIYVC